MERERERGRRLGDKRGVIWICPILYNVNYRLAGLWSPISFSVAVRCSSWSKRREISFLFNLMYNVRLKIRVIFIVLYLICNSGGGRSDDNFHCWEMKYRILLPDAVLFASGIKMQKVIRILVLFFSIFKTKGISSPRILLAHSSKVIVLTSIYGYRWHTFSYTRIRLMNFHRNIYHEINKHK